MGKNAQKNYKLKLNWAGSLDEDTTYQQALVSSFFEYNIKFGR